VQKGKGPAEMWCRGAGAEVQEGEMQRRVIRGSEVLMLLLCRCRRVQRGGERCRGDADMDVLSTTE
jgi:hypothetical protein